MPRKKTTAPSEEPPSSPPTTRRQTRSRTDAQQSAPSASQRKEKIQGDYQPSTLPRRNAPARAREGSPESVMMPDMSSQVEGGTQSQAKAASSLAATAAATAAAAAANEASQESEEDQVQDLIDFTIHDLASRSNALHQFLQKVEAVSPNEISWARLAKIQESFDEQRQKITSSEKYFISQNEVHNSVKKLAGTEHFERSAVAMALANTALLRKLSLEIINGKLEPQLVLEELDDFFPGIFRRQVTADDSLSDYDKAFRIRCLVLAHDITTKTKTSPTLLAAQLFCDPDAVDEIKDAQRHVQTARELLQNGPYQEIGSTSPANMHELKQKHAENMAFLCTKLSQKSRAENVRALENAYPPMDLWKDLSEWAGEVYQRSRESPEKKKGKAPVYIAQASQGSRPKPAAASAASSQIPFRASARNETRTMAPASQTQSGAANGSQGNRRSVPEDESDSEGDELDQSIVRTGAPSGSYLDGSAYLNRRAREIIRQHRATPPSNQMGHKNPLANVDADTILDQFQAFLASQGMSGSQTSSQKRPREEVSIYGEEDEGEPFFDHSRRDGQSPPKRSRLSNSQYAPSVSGYREASVSQSIRYREPSMSQSFIANDEGEMEFGPEDIPILTQKARAATRMHRERRPAQRRQKWDAVDSAALINAIPEFACGWSDMEKQNLFSVPRSQQQIRDKARNLKVDFLKADAPLPRGFDGVVLGKKEIDAVQALGKNPFRLESDLDDYSRPINTIWDPEMDLEEHRIRYRATADHMAD
ncbi:hypothetical protein PFICI_02899 [Pestalotiopsis fici W106-1]|uniref:Myb-like domain-containing protein n=1 Tax=Pestalotiopsis fici (strain W106-1 / CGMCC3.15140) TaxID=1229662 RepID=W3XFT9_PESFW|nr:uncharacterized protein PFICI_02899 [Pestalotiopsis fici W106-1]ETS84874.1 hypothetical protein PFICI_02899 [Pestalotiopsis fici W106-1]